MVVWLRHTRRVISMAHHELSSKTSVKALNDGNSIPVFGFGTFQTGEQASLWALKHGYRLLDTATSYKNEEEVGSAVRKSGIPRKDIFITTKVQNPDHGKENTLKAFQDSLKRLALDYVDLYLMHSPMGGKTVETWDAMVELKEKGLIKSIGVSNFNVHHLQQLKQARPGLIPSVNQIEIHPYLSWDEVVAYCQQEGIVIEAYSSVVRGRKLNDPPLLAMAQKHKKSTAQVLIRWCLQRGFVCIPRSVKEHRIIENGDVFDFEISPEDMQTLNGLNENLRLCWPVQDPMESNWDP